MMELLIKNGTVINAAGRQKADVAVKDGKIVSVSRDIEPAAWTEVVDASDLLVLPGAIDVHTHFELPFGDIKSADDFYTGTRAAACGGVTTVIDFVSPEKSAQTPPGKSGSLIEAFNVRNSIAAPKVCIDYGLHMGLSELNDSVLDEMQAVINAGIPSFKVFMTYAFRLTDNEFGRALARAREIGALIMVHAENHEKLESLKADFLVAGETSPWHHYLSRPETVETEAVVRAIELAKTAAAPLYVVHLACGGGVEAIRKARLEGYPVFAETCPQYLNFTSEVYKKPDGRNFVCSPPIKGEQSRDELWQGIKNGSISIVATDHCPFRLGEKERGKNDFTKIPNGVMGTENLYPYILGQANKGCISFEKAVELCAANPAKIFGCPPGKGLIAPGADADIVLYDPKKEFTISHKNMHSETDYTIWESTALKGYPVSTYSRGILIYNEGKFLGQPGHGRFIKRNTRYDF